MKETEDDTNNWKDIPYSCTGRMDIAKMTILSKAICRLNVIPIKISMAFFTELEQKPLNFVWKHKSPQNNQNNLEKEGKRWRNQAPCHQTILQIYSHQNSMILTQKQTHRSVHQNRKPRYKLMHLRSNINSCT